MTTNQIEITFRVSRNEATALPAFLRRMDATSVLSSEQQKAFEAAREKLRTVLRIWLEPANEP